MQLIKEYMDLVYYNYDKMIYSLPTGAGANMGILNIVARESEKGDYYTMILSPMEMLNKQMFNDFSIVINKDLSYNSIETYYTNNKRSFVLFRTFNRVENQIWDDIDNVILFNFNLKKNNEQTLMFIDNIKKVNNKKIFINCNIEDRVQNVIIRKLGKENFYINNPFLFNEERILKEILDIKLDIRNKKVKKITQMI
jgi:hypothetical protein